MTNCMHQDGTHATRRRGRVVATLMAASLGAWLAAVPARAQILDEPMNVFPRELTRSPVQTTIPVAEKCLRFYPQKIQDGPLTYVTIGVQNICQATMRIDARADLMIHVLGSPHSFVADSGKLDEQGYLVLHATLSNGIVAQEACTKLDGMVIAVDVARSASIHDFRCF